MINFKFKFPCVGGSHASTIECLCDCLLDIMLLSCQNKLILLLLLLVRHVQPVFLSDHFYMLFQLYGINSV